MPSLPDIPAPRVLARSRQALHSSLGAFDLPSILVGVVVVGVLTAGVLASIFGVIPFVQDNGAKQDLTAVRTAEGVAKTKDGKFLNTAGLSGAGYLPATATSALDPVPGADSGLSRVAATVQLTVSVGVPADAHCYLAVSKSGTGTIFYGSDVVSEARELTPADDPGCLSKTEIRALVESIGGFKGGFAPAAPTPEGSVSSRTVAVFTWPAVDGATGYRVEYRVNGGDWTIKSDNQTETTAAIGAEETNTVEARVAARNADGDSDYGMASVKLADRIVINGGFEDGLTPWTGGGVKLPSISTNAHTGSKSVLLGDRNTAQSNIMQTVTVPNTAAPSLTYWFKVASTEIGCRFDYFNVEARTPPGTSPGSVLSSTALCASTPTAWTSVTIPLTAYKGQTIALWFNVSADNSNISSVLVDDVTIKE